MIYWFTGQPLSGKSTLGKKLKDFLQTEKRNWRKDVFHIDGDEILELLPEQELTKKVINQNIKNTQLVAKFIQSKGCDVVVSLVSANKKLRDEFKEELGDNIVEIYVHTNKKKTKEQNLDYYEIPDINFFELDTTMENPVQSFTKLIHYLRDTNKI
jgi:adenylylsulfate kinase-like enzyme